MHILSTLASAAILALATAVPAQAAITVYTANLDGPSEAPPNASPALGLVAVTVDDSSFTMRVQTAFFGLTGTVTAAHIHCCTAVAGSGTASVATATPTFPGFPSGVTAGFYDQTFDMTLASSYRAGFITGNGGTPTTAFAALKSGLDDGKAYFNVHTTTFGGGEIRGFPMAPVPEPQTYALLLAGLGMLGWVARRRQHG